MSFVSPSIMGVPLGSRRAQSFGSDHDLFEMSRGIASERETLRPSRRHAQCRPETAARSDSEAETKQDRVWLAASFLSTSCAEARLSLRLRLEPASLLTDRPRLAGRRHGGARSGRGLPVGRRFAHGPHALQETDDLITAQRLKLQ